MNMSKITNETRSKLNGWLVTKTGMGLFDYPDTLCYEDWLHDEMTLDDIDDILPDLAWEILDLSGMNRDTVDRLCYPENFED